MNHVTSDIVNIINPFCLATEYSLFMFGTFLVTVYGSS